MDGIMDFVVANYQWVFLGVLVFVMIIVGYVADKTDFGHKKSKNDNNNNTPLEDGPINEIPMENLEGKTLSDVVSPNQNTPIGEISAMNEDLNAPFGSNTSTQNVYQPINEDLNAPFGDTSSIQNIQPVSEDLNAPFGDSGSIPFEPVANNNVLNSIPSNLSEITSDGGIVASDIASPIGEVQNTTFEPNQTVSAEVQNHTPSVFEPITSVPIAAEQALADNNVLSTPVNSAPLTSIFDMPNISNETVVASVGEPKEETNANSAPAPAYEENVVPEVITEQLNPEPVTTADDMWKF
ncbi:MAG: hypothetical protein IJ565_01085 [Bacilli bacterium]|nr:hypothetical protein [Bacilli bacterium]